MIFGVGMPLGDPGGSGSGAGPEPPGDPGADEGGAGGTTDAPDG